jgi:uncharacterized membrane protein YsdA (DUF1294 family)
MPWKWIVLGYLAAISLVSVAVTVYDKLAAKRRPRRRAPEKTLMLLGLSGGAAAMYVTMLLIRHKTQHKKFMIGLPLFIVLHVLTAAVLLYFFIFRT